MSCLCLSVGLPWFMMRFIIYAISWCLGFLKCIGTLRWFCLSQVLLFEEKVPKILGCYLSLNSVATLTVLGPVSLVELFKKYYVGMLEDHGFARNM